MDIVPITFRQACDFVRLLHRHNKPPAGHKFSIGLLHEGVLVGVAMGGRPVARFFDDGLTLEVNRTCTDGTRNANSMLYGAMRRAAWGMGYRRIVTYTQTGESGASLRAAGFSLVKTMPARKSWGESSIQRGAGRTHDFGGIERYLWEIRR
ncbi:XF1762 family protein [Klebsiella sp. D5A]|uniref:XF1762 family protein n=1 Tax=Klebsiella sp. D5A TaxID=1140114 RepID=UPI000940A166|nr:XF1762 family protein [Klebsiella sp. D5A]